MLVLQDQFVKLGGTLHDEEKVHKVIPGSLITVETTKDRYKARKVVITTGRFGNFRHLHIPRCKTTTCQKSFTIRTVRIWNTLADELNFNTTVLSRFKIGLLNYYFVPSSIMTVTILLLLRVFA